jgi:2Fe-2S ferredoxin
VIVRVEPSGALLSLEPGETLLAAATRLGFTWPSACGGQASCRTCFVAITDGGEHFPPPDAVEQRGLDELRLVARHREATLRLACQAAPSADAVVVRRGVRPRIVTTPKESP